MSPLLPVTSTLGYGFGTQEILIIAGIVFLLFGGAKLPELAKGLGEGIREFKKSVNGEEPAKKSEKSESSSDTDSEEAPAKS